MYHTQCKCRHCVGRRKLSPQIVEDSPSTASCLSTKILIEWSRPEWSKILCWYMKDWINNCGKSSFLAPASLKTPYLMNEVSWMLKIIINTTHWSAQAWISEIFNSLFWYPVYSSTLFARSALSEIWNTSLLRPDTENEFLLQILALNVPCISDYFGKPYDCNVIILEMTQEPITKDSRCGSPIDRDISSEILWIALKKQQLKSPFAIPRKEIRSSKTKIPFPFLYFNL